MNYIEFIERKKAAALNLCADLSNETNIRKSENALISTYLKYLMKKALKLYQREEKQTHTIAVTNL